jgi:hypothetical protein
MNKFNKEKSKSGVAVYTCNPSTQKAEVGGSQFWSTKKDRLKNKNAQNLMLISV